MKPRYQLFGLEPHPATGSRAQERKPSGFRIFAIKPGSLLARIGFQSGDLVQALNGNAIATPDKALEAYARLRTAELVRVSLLREGKPMAIEMKIE